MNDTTGCLIACAYKHPDCRVGVIIGTGTNASYVEKLELVDLYEGDKPLGKSEVVINTEDHCSTALMIPLYIYRSDKARVLFETRATDGVKCLDKCQQYNRAQAPIFSDQANFDELVSWVINTTMDPVTKHQYSSTVSTAFCISIT